MLRSRSPEHEATACSGEYRRFYWWRVGHGPGPAEHQPVVHVDVDQARQLGIIAEVAFRAGQRESGGCLDPLESQGAQHLPELRYGGPIHQQVDIPGAGEPALRTPAALPLAVEDGVRREGVAEPAHEAGRGQYVGSVLVLRALGDRHVCPGVIGLSPRRFGPGGRA